jgi:hypothetical protein
MVSAHDVKKMMTFDVNSMYDVEKTKVKYDALWRKCNEIYNIFKNDNIAQHIDASVILTTFSSMIREIGEHAELVPRHMALMHSDFITKVLNLSAGLTAIKKATSFEYAKLSVCELPLCSFIYTQINTLPATCYADLSKLHTATVDLYEIWVQPEFDFAVFTIKIREFLVFAGTTPELSRCKAGLAFIEQCLAGISDNTSEYYKTYMSTGSATNTIMDIFSDIKMRAKDSMSKNKYKIIYDIQKIGTFVMNRANSNQTPIVAKIKENLTTCLSTLEDYLKNKQAKKNKKRRGKKHKKPAESAPASTSASVDGKQECADIEDDRVRQERILNECIANMQDHMTL